MGKLLVVLVLVLLVAWWWRRRRALAPHSSRPLPYDKGPTIDVEPLTQEENKPD